MTMKKARGCAVLALLALAAAAPASAQDRGWYAGVDVGISDFPDDAVLNLDGVILETEDDRTDQFVKRFDVGFRFNRWFATEVGYVDPGEVKIRLFDPSGNNRGQGELRFGVKGPTVAAVAFWPLGKWEPFIKVGMIFPEVNLDVDAATLDGPFVARLENDAARPWYGIGVNYRFNDRWKMKLEIDYYDGLGSDDSTGTANVITATLGVVCRF